jgi:hypothetical protein
VQTGVDIRIGGTVERQQDTGSQGRGTSTNKKGKKGGKGNGATAARGAVGQAGPQEVEETQVGDPNLLDVNGLDQNGKEETEAGSASPSIMTANESVRPSCA